VDKATNTSVATIPVGRFPISLGDATGFAFHALFGLPEEEEPRLG